MKCSENSYQFQQELYLYVCKFDNLFLEWLIRIMDAILKRHSVRTYTDKPISDDIIEQLLHAGLSAPSAMHSSPWHLVVITDNDKMTAITKIHPYSHMMLQAQCAILVCGDQSAEIFPEYFQQNCAAATENILIAATDLGLGSVWVGLYPNEQYRTNFKQLFNLPENIEPFALIPLGYPSQPAKASNRLDSSRIHRNDW